MNMFLLSVVLFGAEPSDPLPQMPEKQTETSVRMEVSIEGQPAERAWRDFLKSWRKQFDTDLDGKLNGGEIKAVPALLNSANAPVRIEVAEFDSDKDDKLDDDEIFIGYRIRGVQSITMLPMVQDQNALHLSAVLWSRLDRDRDGRLTSEELADAYSILNRLDLNEDECLSVNELDDSKITSDWTGDVAIKWISPKEFHEEPVMIRIPLSDKPLMGRRQQTEVSSVTATQPVADRVRLYLEQIDSFRVRQKDERFRLVLNLTESSARRIAAAEKFLLAEINSVRMENKPLNAAQIRTEAVLEWLVPLIGVIDANQNDELEEREIEKFVNLLAEGAATQVSISVKIRGRNLFDLLDANADGQLDLHELLHAKETCGALNAPKPVAEQITSWESNQVPLSFLVEVRRGPVNGRFARLRIAQRQNELPEREKPVTKVPRWFEAQDRNQDQQLSTSEFLGSPARFAELDKNSDGLISADEIVLESN